MIRKISQGLRRFRQGVSARDFRHSQETRDPPLGQPQLSADIRADIRRQKILQRRRQSDRFRKPTFFLA